ncbi:hypothetical protein [Paenibacillus terrae]|uniref:Uncharacterized protein n=1 Tax=Paenibacillus terrae TaxID=159743 RepID=A0A0D7WVU2_9BACL|nr:hypothetical protein [Paenibacillus terrae]KJD42838.1 hypothetical protein QD47_25975 [Paenibacillus terrae]
MRIYGTELEIEKLRDELELVVLPSEMVVPLFADSGLLPMHVSWQFEGDAARLAALAPAMESIVAERKFIPSFEAYKNGKLWWTWDAVALDAKSRRTLLALEAGGRFVGRDDNKPLDELLNRCRSLD